MTTAAGPKPSNDAGFQGLRSKVVTSKSMPRQRSKVVAERLLILIDAEHKEPPTDPLVGQKAVSPTASPHGGRRAAHIRLQAALAISRQ